MSANTVLSESQLLAWYLSGEKPPVADDDITANKHGGNEESVEANRRNKLARECDRREVFRKISQRPSTMKQVAAAMGRQFNTLSGRGSDLKRMGLIRKTGEIIDGSAVLEATGLEYPND